MKGFGDLYKSEKKTKKNTQFFKEQLINKGYFMQDSISLNLRGLAAV